MSGLREDVTFQAAWNRVRMELRREAATRLHHLTQTALNAVHSAVESGDAKIALAVLKGVGVLDGRLEGIGSEDPEVVKAEADLVREESQSRRRQRVLIVFVDPARG